MGSTLRQLKQIAGAVLQEQLDKLLASTVSCQQAWNTSSCADQTARHSAFALHHGEFSVYIVVLAALSIQLKHQGLPAGPVPSTC